MLCVKNFLKLFKFNTKKTRIDNNTNNYNMNIKTIVGYDNREPTYDEYKKFINSKLKEYYKSGLIDQRPKFYKK